MSTEQNQDDVIDENNDGEGEQDKDEKVSIPKKDYDILNQTIGSLKRELKDLKKPKEEPKETPKTKSDDELLKRLDNMALKMAGITADDEVELFNKWKEQTGREADSITENKIFQAELADLRIAKANVAATSDIKGKDGKGGSRDDPDYWKGRMTKDGEGNPVLPDDFPMGNTELLQEVIAKFVSSEKKEDKRFYNSK